MMRSNLLISLYVGAVAYLLGVLLAGPAGLETMRKSEQYRDELVGHIENLERIGSELGQTIRELETSRERIRLEARRLQYFAAGEKVIKIEGYSGRVSSLTPGGLLLPQKIEQSPQNLHRALTLCAGLLTFIVLGFFRFDGRSQRKRTQTASRE
jgi:hypothetical protein